MEKKETVKRRNGDIDILRLLFALSVVFLHFNKKWKFGFFINGYIGVEFFYILTGFLTSKHISSKQEEAVPLNKVGEKTWSFLLNKIKSFYRYYLSVIFLQVIVVDLLLRHRSLFKTAAEFLSGMPTLTLTFMGMDMKTRSLYVSGTWYLSAMVIALFLLYPFMLRNYSFAVTCLFPMLSLFILGWLYHENLTISCWDDWAGLTYCGVLRAVAEIAFGASLYELTGWLSRRFAGILHSDRVPVRIMLTAAKAGCFLPVFLFAYGTVMGHRLGRSFDLSVFFILAAGIALCFAGAGYCFPDSVFTRFCGKASLGIYIFHGMIQLIIIKLTKGTGVTFSRFAFYILTAAAGSVLLMYGTDLFTAGIKKLTAH